MTEAQAAAKADVRRWFYHWMALTCLAISVVGFMPTFFVPVVQGAFAREPIVALHGLFFFAWVIYFCTQTWMAASGRVLAHREWGLLGVAIATAMAFSVVAMHVMRLNQAPPEEPIFVILQIASIAFFEACIVAALANVRRPEVHKRFMLLATISILGAPIGRWWAILFAAQIAAALSGPPGVSTILLMNTPVMLASLLIVAAMAFDWRTRRLVSPVYSIGLPVFVLLGPVCAAIGETPAALAVVAWLKGVGG